MIDESNKNSGEKYLCMMVQLFNEEAKSVEDKFFNFKSAIAL